MCSRMVWTLIVIRSWEIKSRGFKSKISIYNIYWLLDQMTSRTKKTWTLLRYGYDDNCWLLHSRIPPDKKMPYYWIHDTSLELTFVCSPIDIMCAGHVIFSKSESMFHFNDSKTAEDASNFVYYKINVPDRFETVSFTVINPRLVLNFISKFDYLRLMLCDRLWIRLLFPCRKQGPSFDIHVCIIAWNISATSSLLSSRQIKFVWKC